MAEAEHRLSKHHLITHALALDSPAVSDLTSLTKLRVEKRLQQDQAPAGRAVDLLRLIDPTRDAVQGTWVVRDRVLITPNGLYDRLQVPYPAPAAYRLTLEVERKQGDNSFYLGIPVGKQLTAVNFDGWPGNGFRSGLDLLDRHRPDRNESTVKGPLLPAGHKHQIVCKVRPGEVAVVVDDHPMFRWRGDAQRLSVRSDWTFRSPRPLFVGTYDATFLISKFQLEPLTAADR